MAKKKQLKESVEAEIAKMLESTEEPSDGRIKLLALGIKMCALNAKLEESEYGDFFTDDGSGSTGGVSATPAGPKPATRRRANGGDTPDA